MSGLGVVLLCTGRRKSSNRNPRLCGLIPWKNPAQFIRWEDSSFIPRILNPESRPCQPRPQPPAPASAVFESIALAPADPILGLNDAFAKDPNPEKINLGVGVFQDASGKTPILPSVKEAERRLLDGETSKGYLAISGSPQYASLVGKLVFGADHPAIAEGRVATAHTPGGTGGLRVAADFIKQNVPGAKVWLSEPTWPNHPSIFRAAGLETATYPYFDAAANGLAFDKMLGALGEIPKGDVVLLHGCCHNPTGVDPTAEQWAQIAKVVSERGLLPLVDFAYQGFGTGLVEDAVGVRTPIPGGVEMLVVSSFSKNFGLYNERVGALTLVSKSAQATQAAFSQIKVCIRANYSNPPCHGAAIVSTILGDAALAKQWEQELAGMRDRINTMRKLFVKTLAAKGIDRDFSFIERQRGMFSFSGLKVDQVERLKKEFAIYAVGSGRINVAGMTEANMDRLCSAIAVVLK
jgi:aspartate/tyrosine/aromatic aminotransferase